MKGSNQFAVVFRRMSVVYTFLVATAIVLLVYYYYIIPNHKAEFSERSSRALNTLVLSFKKEVQGLKNTFSQRSLSSPTNHLKLIGHGESYGRLFENIHYEVDTNWHNPNPQESIQYVNDWKLLFALDSTPWWVQVPVQNFSNRIFIARADVFSSYILLLPDTNSTPQNRTLSWHIIYKQDKGTSSDQLLLDSTVGLFRNSDMSTVVEATLGGRSQKIFLNAFSLGNQVILLGGIISKSKYDGYIHAISTNFVVAIIIFIIVLLIVLPLLKIYFLSRNETIYSRDVIASTISIFMGTAAILLILIFAYLYSVSFNSFHNRMHDIGNQISGDIEKQLDSANQQLDRYIKLYDSLSEAEKNVLTYQEIDADSIAYVDSLFYPYLFPHLTRVLWVDSLGETLAKWNPLNYKAPLTTVKDHGFFKRLKAVRNLDKQKDIIVYSGKSNLTGDFQVYVAKPVRQLIHTWNNKDSFSDRYSIGIVLATSLYCNTVPVLPPGFSFCLFDNKGDVLLHSEETRNLAENFFEETGFNQQVVSSVQQKTDAVINNVTLYGASHDIVVKPIKGQSLSIAVFYPTKRVIGNISRFLHFSIACLVGLFAIIIFFILYLTYRNSKPSQLRFRLNKIQWIRPAAGNRHAYRFSQWYFFSLIAVTVITFIFIQAFDFDFRDMLYLSFLLPFYSLMGLITANQKLIREGQDEVLLLRDEYKLAAADLKDAYQESAGSFFSKLYEFFTHPLMLPGLLIFLLNLQFIYSLIKGKDIWSATGILLLVQAVFIWAFIFFYRKSRNRLNIEIDKRKLISQNENSNNSLVLAQKEISSEKYKFDKQEKDGELVPTNYLWSLYFVLILVTVLPTFGIATYAFFAEKTQYKKTKELFIAQQLDRKYRYLQSQFRANYKSNLVEKDKVRRPDLSLLMQGNYLSDHDRIDIKDKPLHVANAIYDEPYREIINHLYSFTSPYFGEFATKNESNDNTWQFASQNDSLVLYYNVAVPDSLRLRISSYYQNPLQNFWRIFWSGDFIFPIVIVFFLVFLFWYLGSTMRRLFLLNFSKPCETSKTFLEEYFENTDTDPLYSSDAPRPITTDFFQKEEESNENQEEYILKMSFCFLPVYEKIWEDLSEKEKYILYDLSKDGYTNYKNTDIIFQLLTKGILNYSDYKLKFFSLSFQNFVIGQRDDAKMQEIVSKYNVGGMWRSLRVPILLISGVIGVFIVLTQSDVAHDLTAFITSIVALIPLLIQLVGRNTNKTES